jgi:hypothetical protein
MSRLGNVRADRCRESACGPGGWILGSHFFSEYMVKKKNSAAVELGRKGGKASAERLTAEQRKEKARKAAQARWTKRPK